MIDYFMRYCNDELTEEEKQEEKRIAEANKNRKVSDNQYAACGCWEDELTLSIDTH